MTLATRQLTTAQKVASTVFGGCLVLCSLEMVPGWGIFHLAWPREIFYLIMAAAGAFVGALLPNRLAGISSGILAGVGALFAQAVVLENAVVVSRLIFALVGMLGTLPGIALYFGLHLIVLPGEPISKERRPVVSMRATAPPDRQLLPHGPIEPSACPVCGGHRFQKKATEQFLAVLADRSCRDCGTRYAPPTPRWAGILYIFAGVAAFASAVGCVKWNQIEPAGEGLKLGKYLLIAALAIVLGGISLVWGVRCFFVKSVSKVVPTKPDEQN